MKYCISSIMVLILPYMISAQHGKVYDNLSMESRILGMERKYAVYLPPDYESSERSYPVLYLLHGSGDDDSLYEGNSLVHIALRKKNVPHEFRIRDSAHDWTYWRESLPGVLSFVSDHFHQH